MAEATLNRSNTAVAGTFRIGSGSGARTVELATYLDAAAAERATTEANAWIKSLRHLTVDTVPLRDRFTYRGDSFWWFIEAALGREKTVVAAFKTLAALDSFFARESQDALALLGGNRLTHVLAPAVARLRGVTCGVPHEGRFRHDTRSKTIGLFHLGETLSARMRGRRPRSTGNCRLAVFVHSAFWSATRGDRYLGPIIRALEKRLPPGHVQIVGIGPQTSRRIRETRRSPNNSEPEPRPFEQIERYASLRTICPSLRVWLRRNAVRRALLRSPELGQSMTVRGCDLSSLLREELDHVMRNHVPWSARAMDEAGAALDALQPRAAVTYAEAGAWGRALVLEGRRRGIPVVGVQHGFISRHWLNYRHERDELLPSTANPADGGYPLPDLTLLFDGYAAASLREMGNVPASALRVTGSPELDALANAMGKLSEERLEATRAVTGAAPGQITLLILSKFTEIQPFYTKLMEAIRRLPTVRAVVKCHPVEAPQPYLDAGEGVSNLTVLESDAEMAPLLRLSRLVVTVNSTLALHATALGIPALALGLPNNLSPFVDGGMMAGLHPHEPIAPTLSELLYDDTQRQALASRAKAFAERYEIRANGQAVRQMTDAILEFV